MSGSHSAELSALVSRAEANRAEMSRLQAERADVCAEALELVARRVAQRAADRPGASGRAGAPGASGASGASGARGEIGDTIPLREVLAELSAALRVGERTVSNWLGDGAALAGTYVTTLDALRAGRIDERHASAIIDAGMSLAPENRATYEALILPIAERETAPATKHHARIIAARLQPQIVEENAQRAVEGRRVQAFDLDDGLARLLLDGPAVLIHAIYERLTAMGAAAQAEGESAAGDAGEAGGAGDASDVDDTDERTLDQRRADIMCDLLLTGAPAAGRDSALGAVRATVQITVPILTLAGIDDDPALLDGHGPIDAETARALAASAPCWQRVMVHPVTFEQLRLDTYRPSKRLRRLIGARDQHCRWPGCRRSARRSDIDHTIA